MESATICMERPLLRSYSKEDLIRRYKLPSALKNKDAVCLDCSEVNNNDSSVFEKCDDSILEEEPSWQTTGNICNENEASGRSNGHHHVTGVSYDRKKRRNISGESESGRLSCDATGNCDINQNISHNGVDKGMVINHITSANRDALFNHVLKGPVVSNTTEPLWKSLDSLMVGKIPIISRQLRDHGIFLESEIADELVWSIIEYSRSSRFTTLNLV